MQKEVETGIALTEYRKAKAELKKHPNPDLARQLLDAVHADVLAIIDRRHDPHHEPKTVLDLAAHLDAHPEERDLTPEDLLALETLPPDVRTRLKELLHLPAA